MPKTIFCDIDGTILQHLGDVLKNRKDKQALLPHVLETFRAWDREGHTIILTTARKESERVRTEEQLRGTGISYDRLIMGLPAGDRILINDRKPHSDRDTAYAINLARNQGLTNISLNSKHVILPDSYLNYEKVTWNWGNEQLLEANGRFSVKHIEVGAGMLSPIMICHLRKKILVVLSGLLCLKHGDEEVVVEEGCFSAVAAGVEHAYYSLDGCVLTETSSHELWDSYVLKE